MPPFTTPKGGLIQLSPGSGSNPASGPGGPPPGSSDRWQVILPDRPPRSPVPPGRRVLGLLLILLAAWLGTMPAGQWTGLVARVRAVAELGLGMSEGPAAGSQSEAAGLPGDGPVSPRKREGVAPAAEATVEETGVPATGEAEEASVFAGQPWAEWVRWGIVGLAAIGALSLLHSLPFAFLLTAVLIGGSGYALLELVRADGMPPWRWLIVGAVVPAYLVHSSAVAPRISGRGLPGLALVLAAAIGQTRGWFDWSGPAAALGDGPARLARDYGVECAWGTTLFLATLGGLCSRTRIIHILIAALLVALAYYCIVSGKIVVREFPTLSRAGEALKTQIDDSFGNVARWRWVLLVELSTIAAALVYKGLGVGGMNLAFAALWMLLGCFFYEGLRSMSMLGFAGRTLAPYLTRPPSSAPTPPPDPLGGTMGLPIGPLPPASVQRPDFSDPATPERLRRIPPPELARPRDRRFAEPTSPAAGTPQMVAAQRQLTVREVGLPLWIYLTAIHAAVLAVAGLRLLRLGEAARAAVGYTLWLVLGAGLAWMWMLDPREPSQSWLSWLSDWAQSPHKLHVVWLIFFAAAASASAWALRPTAKVESWVHASIVCAFLATAVTLIWLAVLSYFGGFDSLPIWTYAAIAVGQSLPAWVLLVQQSLERHHQVATTA